MGSMKEYWMETRPDYEISFSCPSCDCKILSSIRAPSLEEYADEESTEETIEKIECLYCDATWTVELIATKDDLVATVLDRPSTPVSFSEIDWSNDGYWEDYPEPEPDPHSIFKEALEGWRKLLGTIGDENGGASSENRMLLIQLYSIVEAYLSDAIVGLALRDRSVQTNLISVIESLKDKSVTLSTVAERPEIVRDMVKEALQKSSFHSLVNVNSMCIKALERPILPAEKADRDMLLASVELRHDCVHRNGRDKAGNVHNRITIQYLQRLGRMFRRLASGLDERIREIDFNRQLSVLDGKS
jgi:hypothetical protein